MTPLICALRPSGLTRGTERHADQAIASCDAFRCCIQPDSMSWINHCIRATTARTLAGSWILGDYVKDSPRLQVDGISALLVNDPTRALGRCRPFRSSMSGQVQANSGRGRDDLRGKRRLSRFHPQDSRGDPLARRRAKAAVHGGAKGGRGLNAAGAEEQSPDRACPYERGSRPDRYGDGADAWRANAEVSLA